MDPIEKIAVRESIEQAVRSGDEHSASSLSSPRPASANPL
ncbi:hypothetical protein TVNIR_0972 [Thioalkalivibrio nitratireducens DSM 14787]|uniref:Uncharacterized protein n=1 Tax=Thioalkalivibrio nitratireducens (strain DSM 14787 / UNIQEM 213 / ALEN2) TaxID=1255043 RepID=L0DSR9_THIND|nr:hypothetical protein TVNIR_0972 [Thioalkalivibrio nitratireducens DSM 14787]